MFSDSNLNSWEIKYCGYTYYAIFESRQCRDLFLKKILFIKSRRRRHSHGTARNGPQQVLMLRWQRQRKAKLSWLCIFIVQFFRCDKLIVSHLYHTEQSILGDHRNADLFILVTRIDFIFFCIDVLIKSACQRQ